MNDLVKVILQLQRLSSLKMELHTILYCSRKKRKRFKRVFKASTDGRDLQQHSRDIYDMCKIFDLQLNTSALEGIQSNLVVSHQLLPTLHHDAVGIKEKIEEVIQQFDWENDSTTAAVILNGIGGSGKITLGDTVYPSFKDKFQGWKHSKVTIIQNPEKKPKVEDLQSLILQDWITIKQTV